MKGFVLDGGSGDLQVKQGGAIIDDNAGQVVENLLLGLRGDFKEVPLLGGEAELQLGGERDVMWPLRVKKMLLRVGVEVRDLRIGLDGVVEVEM